MDRISDTQTELIISSVFLAPISGIMAADFWLVKKGSYDLPSKLRNVLLHVLGRLY